MWAIWASLGAAAWADARGAKAATLTERAAAKASCRIIWRFLLGGAKSRRPVTLDARCSSRFPSAEPEPAQHLVGEGGAVGPREREGLGERRLQLRAEVLAQPPAGAEQPRLHGVLGHAQHLGGLLNTELAHLAQDEDGAERLGQAGDRAFQQAGGLPAHQRRIGRF